MANNSIMTFFDSINSFDRFDEMKKYIASEYGHKEDEVSDEQVWEWLADDDRNDWEDFEYLIKSYAELEYGTWVLGGNQRDWMHSGYGLTMTDNILETISKLGDEFTITSENGHFKIHAIHHDGGCYVEARLVTERGLHLYEKWNYNDSDIRTEYEVLETLFENNLFSRLPHLDRLY